MKRIPTFLPLLAAGLALTTALQAAPTQLSAAAGEVRDIQYATGSGATATLYAATQGGGVFMSTNAGSTWTPTALNTGYAWQIAVSKVSATNTVYVATDAGVFKTADSGTSWTQLTFDPARAVAVDPGSVTNDTVLAGVPGQGIIRSTDSGVTWARQATGLDSANVIKLAFQANGVAYALLDCNAEDLVGTTQQGAWGGVFKTTTAGSGNATVTWTNFNNGGGGTSLPTKCVRGLAANSTTVYVGTLDPFNGNAGQIFRSTGAGWTGATAGMPTTGDLFGVESIAVDHNSASSIIGGAHAVGVWSSTDGGVSYAQQADPTPGHSPEVWTRISAIETVPGLTNTVVVAAKGAGIFRTTNLNGGAPGSIVWTLASGITADRVRGLDDHTIAAPSTYWMALENGGVMKSINAGASWAAFDSGFDFGAPLGTGDPYLISAQAIAADPSSTATVLVGTRGGGLLNLNGTGDGWVNTGVPASVRNNGVNDFKPQSLLIPATNQVYYTLFDAPSGSGAGGLLVSATGPAGLAQTPYPDGITSCATPVSPSASARKVVQAADAVAFLLRYDDLPYRSTNDFASATAGCVVIVGDVGFERLAFFDIAQQPTDNAIMVATTNKGIYRSTDTGNTWNRVPVAGLPTPVLASVAYISSGILYGVNRSGGFYCSTDNGDNWQAVSLGSLPPVSMREVKVINGAIHILTDGGGVYNGFAATCP